ncbi:hypothetical protein WGR33_01615 [Sinorhizobium meliloti]
MPQPGLLGLYQRDSLLNLVEPSEMEKKCLSEGRFNSLQITGAFRVQDCQFLDEEIKAMSLEPQAEHACITASFGDCRSKYRSQNIGLGP